MGIEYFKLNHEALLRFIRDSGSSHTRIAKALGTSSKTIQRLVNKTSTKIRREHLEKMALLFGVDQQALIKSSSECAKISPANKLLSKLTSDSYIQHVRACDEWLDYLKMLKCFEVEELSSAQQIYLHRCVGLAALYIGNLKIAKLNLEKARVKATDFEQVHHLADIYSWLAVHEELSARIKEALIFLDEAEKHIYKDTPLEVRATFHLIKGRILLHNEDFEQSEFHIRKAIRIAYRGGRQQLTRISTWYGYLGWLYLRQRKLRQAKIAFHRLLLASAKSGWGRGKAVGNMALGIIHGLERDKADGIPSHFLGKARIFHEIATPRPLDSRFEQLDFVYKVLCKDYEGALKLNRQRLKAVQSSPFYLAYAILDSVYLAKLTHSSHALDPKLIKHATLVFKSNGLKSSLHTLETLTKLDSLDTKEFLQTYLF